jgi:hypothetical protein
MLVVMFTTITTAQEALKQYDTLKAQAHEWATLRLWTGYISAYTPQDEPLEAQAVACSVSAAPVENSHSQDAASQAHSIEAQSASFQKRHAANHVTNVEVSTIEDKHHDDSMEAGESAFESIGELALLAGPSDAEQEAARERASETAETNNPSGNDTEEVSPVRRLREVRFVNRTLSRELAQPAPLASEAAGTDAALRKARAASRADAKAKALRRAIRIVQIQLERAARVELRTDVRVSGVELPKEINITLPTLINNGSIATDYPAVSQDYGTRPAPASMSSTCTGE